MKFTLLLVLLMIISFPRQACCQNSVSAEDILEKIDKNMFSSTIEYDGEMIIRHKGRTSTKTYHAYAKGTTRSFAVYSFPPKDEGTKFMKINDNLYIYLPAVEKTTRISGHMLRRSMMGSDFSYEDALEQSKLREKYDAEIVGQDTVSGRRAYILELTANTREVTYYRRKVWVDTERYSMLKSERYAKSGKLLKVMNALKTERYNDRWYITHLTMKDKLRKDSMTELFITNPVFDKKFPENIFSLQHLEVR